MKHSRYLSMQVSVSRHRDKLTCPMKLHAIVQCSVSDPMSYSILNASAAKYTHDIKRHSEIMY